MKKIVVLLMLILNICAVNSYALSAKSAVLIDGASGRILYEHNAYEKLPMASTTKIMTGLLSCESGKLNETVKVSAFASGTEGSSLWLKIGEKQTLEDLTYGLMLKSGNDAAVAIAEYLGGNIDAFSLLMNKKAREIGALNTNFENPHGLNAEKHYTTAYDLALIAREAMKNKKFRQIVSTKTYSIPMQGEKWDRALKNHNKLLWRYEGCNGVKTGYTSEAKRCLVSSAKKGKQELICVTLNASDDWNDHTFLLDYGFDNYKTERIIKKGKKAATFTYNKEYEKKVNLIAKSDFSIAKKETEEIVTAVEYASLKAPAKKGSAGAYLHIFCNGKEIGKIELVTEKNIEIPKLMEKLKAKFNSLFF